MRDVTQVAPSVSTHGILILVCSQCGKADSVLLDPAPKKRSLPRSTEVRVSYRLKSTELPVSH
jgi:hypothetical protein